MTGRRKVNRKRIKIKKEESGNEVKKQKRKSWRNQRMKKMQMVDNIAEEKNEKKTKWQQRRRSFKS